jgi:hypothetical protein
MSPQPFLPARFLPALPEHLRREDMPTLPAWYPLPPQDEDGSYLPALPEEERARLRHARAVLEATEGPHDGRRQQVRVTESGAPPAQVVMYDGTVVYRLSLVESNKHQATYRYSPQLSHIHRGNMAAVEEAFHELGEKYAQEASHDDTTAMGYQERFSTSP